MRFGQPGELRPADTDGAAEHALSIVGPALQFRGPAGQHNLPAERPGETAALQRARNYTPQLIEPLADDGDDLRAGDARERNDGGRGTSGAVRGAPGGRRIHPKKHNTI